MLYLFSWGTLSECEACLVNMEGWELFLFIQRTGQENLSSHPIIVHYKLVREPACMKPPACFLAGALPNSPSPSLSLDAGMQIPMARISCGLHTTRQSEV